MYARWSFDELAQLTIFVTSKARDSLGHAIISNTATCGSRKYSAEARPRSCPNMQMQSYLEVRSTTYASPVQELLDQPRFRSGQLYL